MWMMTPTLSIFKNKINAAIISFIIVLLLSFTAKAQITQVTASIDSNYIQIGQQVKLLLSVSYNVNNGKHVKITWPEITDTISKEIEVVNQSKIDTIIADSSNPFQFTQNKTLFITSFDSGTWVIPPIKFLSNTDSTAFYTQALKLNVSNIAVDTTMAIKDVKPILEVNYNWIDWIKDNIYSILTATVAIIIILVIIYYIRKKLKNKPIAIVPEIPKVPAHIIALEKLDKLKNDKLWQEGKLKQYYSILADTVREYTENRFKIQALEQTTDEILLGFRNVAIDEESKAKLKQILLLSDLVKFAKENPLPVENETSMANAYDFINGTKKEEVVGKPSS